MTPPVATDSMSPRLKDASVVICCGSGGVGKTTSAAALALRGAIDGRRACVVTIDPAKRLADALGLESLANRPRRIEGDWPGELWAMMLDTKLTFDELVRRYAANDDQADSILANRLYRNISSALSGTQEYMAMEKLYELHNSPDFDLVVVDTPPTRNALDFLDAPRRLTAFLDNRIFRVLIMPTRAYLKAVSVATQTFLRTVSRVVGAEVVGDVIAFFEAFDGMEAGFRDRAQAVRDLLTAPDTAFVLVTSPRPDAVEEASFFADRLRDTGITVDALVVNRLHPHFGHVRPPQANMAETPLAHLRRNLSDFQQVSEEEEQSFAGLAADVAPATVARVPFLAGDVHDVEGLEVISAYLMPLTA
jgi:anion-transporting  ArsA/GET3 family ATPase